jgi:undecaprenyl-diphosphatase
VQQTEPQRPPPRRNLLLQAVAALWLALLVLFLFLAVCAAFYDRFPSDEYLARRIQDIDVPAFGGFMDFINALGVSWLFVPLTVMVAVLLVARGAWLAGALVMLTFLPRWLNTIAKDAVDRPRPSADLVDVRGMASNTSFPSGHTTGTAVLFGMLLFVLTPLVPWRPVRWLLQACCLLFVASAGVARVHEGVHWPSDALGGYLLALLFLVPAVAALAAIRSRGVPR